MRQSDPLLLVEEGSLERPGPVGRLARLGLGGACMYALYVLLLHHQSIIQRPVSVIPNIAVIVFAAIFIINYVVNIGFGKSFGRWPSYLSLAAGGALAGLGWLLFDTPDHPLLGVGLWFWLVYFYAHLGISFLLAAIIATPGCEMRSIPELVGRITGRAALEHHCPASFITKIDAWERRAATGTK
jgi:hypothetical protein